MPKISKKWLLLALITLSIFLNIRFRLSSLFLPALKEQATREVYSAYRDKLFKITSLMSSALPAATKEKVFESLFKEEAKDKLPQLQRDVIRRTQELKSYYQDEQGWTYLLEIDPYRWLRRIENYLNTGHFGTKKAGNQEYDNLQSASSAALIEPIKIHYLLGAYFFKALHFFNNKLSLPNCLALIPVVLSLVLVITIFVVCSLLGISLGGSFLASLAVGLSPIVLSRSGFGWFDTDIYNLIFPLLIMVTLAYSFKARKSLKQYCFLLLSGLLTGVYAGIWPVWWLSFYIILSGLLLYQLEVVSYYKERSLFIRCKEASLSVFIFIFSSVLFVFFIGGLEVVKKLFLGPLFHLSIVGGTALDNFWPNLAFSIGELRGAEASYITEAIGGNLILYGGLLGLLFTVILKKGTIDFKEKRFLILALTVWLLVSFVLAYFIRRFILFLIIPLGIFLGAFWDLLNDFLTSRKFIKKFNPAARGLFLGCIFIIIALIPAYNASLVRPFPFFNRSWQNMLSKIKEATPKNAVINTYWDYGDYIMSVGQRSTVYDASYQWTPVSYWIPRVFMAQDEEEAYGILKMLDSSGNRLFEELTLALGNDKLRAVEIINKMLLRKEEESRILLAGHIKDGSAIDKILKLFYSFSPPMYLLVDNHTVEIAPVISLLAGWDFRRLDLWQKFLKLKKEEFLRYARQRFGYPQADAEAFYNALSLINKQDVLGWVSPQSYKLYTPYAQKVLEEGKSMLLFDNGLALDLETLKAYYRNDLAFKWLVPGRVLLYSKEGVKENINNEGDASLAVFVSCEGNTYKAILLSTALTQTLLFKLYFMDGLGLKHFKLLHREIKEGFSSIYLYEVS